MLTGGCESASDPSSKGSILVARLGSDGALDGAFGDRGISFTQIRTFGAAAAVVVQPDGRVVVAGYAGDNGGAADEVVLLRYLLDGRLDPGFGDGGLAPCPPGSGSAVALQPDGKILIAGALWLADAGTSRTFIARYDSTGGLDPGFADGGLAIPTPFRSPSSPIREADYDGARAIALEADGRIVTVGQATIMDRREQWPGLTRWTPAGVPDGTFRNPGGAPPGVVDLPLDFGWVGYGLAIQADGKMVAGGWDPGVGMPSGNAALIRLNPDGTLDNSFGTFGVATDPDPRAASVQTLAIEPG